MITTKAIERLAFTITKQNKPNQTDLDALKTLVEWIDNSKKQEIRNNYLFAKMYVYNFVHEVLHYKDSFNFNYGKSQKKIHEILEMPLNKNIEIAREKINAHEYQLFAIEKGISQKFVRSSEEIESDQKIISENESEFLKYGFGYFENIDFEDRIVNQITEAINKYKEKL